MSIQSTEINCNMGFTRVHNQVLRDPRLSLKAKGLMAVMLGLPPNWTINVTGLSKICAESRNTIAGIIKDLESAGYMRRKQNRDNGKFSTNVYELIIDETPNEPSIESDSDLSENVVQLLSDSFLKNRCPKNRCPENRQREIEHNKLYINKQFIDSRCINQSIIQANDGMIDSESKIREEIANQIGLVTLSGKHDVDLVNTVVTVITQTILYQQSPMQIDGMAIPAETIRKALETLDYSMVDEVLDNIKLHSSEITNLRAYLVSCLYRKSATGAAETSLWTSRMFG